MIMYDYLKLGKEYDSLTYEMKKYYKDEIQKHLFNKNSDKVLGKSVEIMKEFNVNQDYANKEQFKKRLKLNGVLEL